MKQSYLIQLSWPSPVLSSNARVHWAKRAKAVKAYRCEAAQVVKYHSIKRNPKTHLRFMFYPPDRRRRDAHNLPHMMKAAIDGIADAMGCDDQQFTCEFEGGFRSPVKNGTVLVEISA